MYILRSPHRAHRARRHAKPHLRRHASPCLTSPHLAPRHLTSAPRGRTCPPPMRALHPRCRQVGGERSWSEPELYRGHKQRSSRAGCVQSADARRDRRLASLTALAAHRGRRGPLGRLQCTARRRSRDPAVPDGHEGGAPSERGEESKGDGRHGVAAAARLRRVKRAILGVAAVFYDAPRYPSIMSRHMYHGVSMDTMCAVRHGAARARVSGFSRTKTLLVSVFCFPWGSAHAQQWLCAPPRAARGAGAPPRARQGFNESTVRRPCSLHKLFHPSFTIRCIAAAPLPGPPPLPHSAQLG